MFRTRRTILFLLLMPVISVSNSLALPGLGPVKLSDPSEARTPKSPTTSLQNGEGSRPQTRSCHVLLFPGAITGAEGGGTGFFIRAPEVFREFSEDLRKAGEEVSLLHLPPDLGVAARSLALRDRVLHLRRARHASGKPDAREVWIAHSQAGVDVRFALKLDPLLRENVQAVLTLGAPHRGTPLATWASSEAVQGGMLASVLRGLAHYDLRALSFLGDLSVDGMRRGESKLLGPREPGEPVFYSAIFRCPAEGCSWPFRLLGWLSGVKAVAGVQGDGLIPIGSQKFGEPLGEFELDHLEQIGGSTDARGRSERGRFHRVVIEWLKGFCS